VACLVRKRDDLLLLNTWDGQLLFLLRTGLLIALALGCQPWELMINASRTEFVRHFVYDKPQITETREEMLQMLAYN